jgi:hypothetical protein
MLMTDAGQPAAGIALLERALTIYEKVLGAESHEAKFVKENLARIRH